MFELPKSIMDFCTVKLCEDCGLEHAPVRSCDETRDFHEYIQSQKENKK
jgi:hypothetical protein